MFQNDKLVFYRLKPYYTQVIPVGKGIRVVSLAEVAIHASINHSYFPPEQKTFLVKGYRLSHSDRPKNYNFKIAINFLFSKYNFQVIM